MCCWIPFSNILFCVFTFKFLNDIESRLTAAGGGNLGGWVKGGRIEGEKREKEKNSWTVTIVR